MAQPSGDAARLEQQLDFLLEIDRLKQVLRQTDIVGGSRRENTAEHSWHLAMFAIVLAEWSDEPVDLARVVQLCLVHDLVEIDAGDTFAYDVAANESKLEREVAAAERLFGMLPSEQGAMLRALWDEYEEATTPESLEAARRAAFAGAGPQRADRRRIRRTVGRCAPPHRRGRRGRLARRRLIPSALGSLR
jgi:putative hydrolase of HD superfamily